MSQSQLMSVDVPQALSVESGESSHQSPQLLQQQHSIHSPLDEIPPMFPQQQQQQQQQQQLSSHKHHLQQQQQHHQSYLQQQQFQHYHQQLIANQTVIDPNFTNSMVSEEIQNSSQRLSDRNDVNMFGDFNFDDHNAFLSQPPPPQPRFSFLPPVNSGDNNEYNSPGVNPANQSHQSVDMLPASSPNSGGSMSREQMYEHLVGPNVTVSQPGFYPYQGQLQSVERVPPSPFLPHLLDSYLVQQQQQQQQQQNNMSNAWQRQNNFDPAMYHHFMGENNSPLSGDARSIASGNYSDYPQVPLNMEGQPMS